MDSDLLERRAKALARIDAAEDEIRRIHEEDERRRAGVSKPVDHMQRALNDPGFRAWKKVRDEDV